MRSRWFRLIRRSDHGSVPVDCSVLLALLAFISLRISDIVFRPSRIFILQDGGRVGSCLSWRLPSTSTEALVAAAAGRPCAARARLLRLLARPGRAALIRAPYAGVIVMLFLRCRPGSVGHCSTPRYEEPTGFVLSTFRVWRGCEVLPCRRAQPKLRKVPALCRQADTVNAVNPCGRTKIPTLAELRICEKVSDSERGALARQELPP